LGSPAVVAASALAGYICGPAAIPRAALEPDIRIHPRSASGAATVDIVDGFPRGFTGRLLFLPQDNLNTDGIYGKDYTYKTDLSPEEMARVAMLNYDPRFQEIAAQGDIIVGGRNFGSGSSREQAATALAFRGIRMVVAASFSQTYKRNAFNNGFVVTECPELVSDLQAAMVERVRSGDLTIPCPDTAEVDFAAGVISYGGKRYPFAPLGRVPQQLVAAGGAEALVRHRLAGA
jgi:homoaconitate hydratase